MKVEAGDIQVLSFSKQGSMVLLRRSIVCITCFTFFFSVRMIHPPNDASSVADGLAGLLYDYGDTDGFGRV